MPRIKAIPRERAAVVLRSLYDAAAKQFGSVPLLFQCMAHRPELLLTFSNFYRELWTGGVVDAATKELAAVRAAAVSGSAYAQAHTGAAGALSEAQRAALARDDWAGTGLFDERQQAVIRLAEKLTRAPASVSEDDIQGLRKWFGEAHLVELSLLIGTLNLTSRFAQGFDLEP